MAVYDISGDMIADLPAVKEYNILAYNVGNFADYGAHGGYSGDDLDGWITKWVQFFGKYSPDVCLLTESRLYVDSAMTALSKDRIYTPLYEFVSNYNNSTSWGVALLSNNAQNDVHSSLFDTLVSAESKYLYTIINLNDVNVFMAVAHLNHTVSGKEQESIAARAAQMAELIEIASDYDNVIIGGDFNVLSLSEMNPFITAGYTLGNGGIFGEFETWEDDPSYPLDNILIKGNKLRLKDFETFEGVTSHDHLATMAKILIG